MSHKTGRVTIEMFDRDVLKYASIFNSLKEYFKMRGQEIPMKDMENIENIFTNALLEQTTVNRANSITKKRI